MLVSAQDRLRLEEDKENVDAGGQLMLGLPFPLRAHHLVEETRHSGEVVEWPVEAGIKDPCEGCGHTCSRNLETVRTLGSSAQSTCPGAVLWRALCPDGGKTARYADWESEVSALVVGSVERILVGSSIS